ncbi:MAG: DUF1845 domain-containing protein [Sterolibacteriaceae bacterium]|nr:DUF1845 domain-containing protein [Candidatus Methylophosphatis haderslevensis]
MPGFWGYFSYLCVVDRTDHSGQDNPPEKDMNGPANVRLDEGAVNQRILAREAVGDYRRVEQASLKQIVSLKSPEAKRVFARYFHSLQLNTHFISDITRIRLATEDVEKVEEAIRSSLVRVKDELISAIEGARLLFKNEGITAEATYDTMPLEQQVGVISSFGRRYLECLQQFDQLMPMLRTLEILEVITPAEIDRRRALFKRAVTKPPKSARALADGLRRRMDDATKRAAQQTSGSAQQNVQPPEGEATSVDPVLPDGAGATLDSSDSKTPMEVTAEKSTRSRKPRTGPPEPTQLKAT